MKSRGLLRSIHLAMAILALTVVSACDHGSDIGTPEQRVQRLTSEIKELRDQLGQEEAARKRLEAISRSDRQLRDSYTDYLSKIMERLREMTSEEASVLEMVTDAESGHLRSRPFDAGEAERKLQSIEAKLNLNRQEINALKAMLNEAQKADSETAAYIESLLKTVDDLTSQLDEKTRTIGELRISVNRLRSQVSDLERAKLRVEAENERLRDWLSAWVLCGPKKRLKDLAREGLLIEVRGTYAPTADCLSERKYAGLFMELTGDERRRVPIVPRETGKIEVRSVHRLEDDLYRFNPNGGNPVLEIAEPEPFWALSPFLVVKTE